MRISLDVNVLPDGAELLVQSGTMRYRTDHFNGELFANRRMLNDLTLGAPLITAKSVSPPERPASDMARP